MAFNENIGKPANRQIGTFRFVWSLLSDAVFGTLVVFCILNASLVVYGLRMAKGQLSIVFNARPVTEVIADPAVADSVKIKLKLIEDIRQFAFDSIGLNRNDNYTTFYDQHGKRLIYVVTACKPFALEPHRWHFPVLGDVPYKGFFNPEKASEEAKRLKREGWDVDVGGASGWSTLGFFKDPVLSQMLKYKEGDLAELIIHELTHGTIFVKDDVEYNENLASFIGYKGAVLFLERKYGSGSPQLKAYLDGRKDDEAVEKYMLDAAHDLDSLYKHFPPGCDSLCKNDLRKKMFHRVAESSRHLALSLDTLFPARFEKRLNASGNTIFMQYLRYGGKQHSFEAEFARFLSIKAYLDWLKRKYGK
jgi:predicted aminopeptidase